MIVDEIMLKKHYTPSMSIVPNNIGQINELMPGVQVGSNVQFDLGDDSFANLLSSKLDELSNSAGEVYTQLMGPMGVPIGLNIEGLTDDPFKVNAIDAGSMSELSLNQSEGAGFDEDVVKSGGHRIDKSLMEQLGAGRDAVDISLTDLMAMAKSKNTIKSPFSNENTTGFGNFMKKQAAGMYGTMGKGFANNVADILSAL